MNLPTDPERLLGDVLAESAPADFRAALLAETLCLARRRRRLRQTRRVVAVIALVAGVAALLWSRVPTRTNLPRLAAQRLPIIHSEPLPAAARVTTQPLPTSDLTTSVAGASLVRTTPQSGGWAEIGDRELLDLAAPKLVALVRRAPHSAELVFVHPLERQELLGN